MSSTPPFRSVVTDDLQALLSILPPRLQDALGTIGELRDLLELVLDLGRPPEARFPGREVPLPVALITREDIEYVLGRTSTIGGDNRAGIERTLHRISVIRNRAGRPIGLTCRVGRAVYGAVSLVRDLVESGQSILLLGKPGVGKTTMLREVARVLADDLRKRVVIVDTSNEIAGDGDIPHPGIGRARRMQVSTPSEQHAVMIEAVENHMPEVIIIDEIGTELEAAAARTIAERGVQLVGTAHGNTLDNLMMNPTLTDLVGGIQTVTLGDDEARRRGTQKSVLERKGPPTFQVLVEIIDWRHVTVHPNVAETVDSVLRGHRPTVEVREVADDGSIRRALLRGEAPRAERTRPSLHAVPAASDGRADLPTAMSLPALGADAPPQAASAERPAVLTTRRVYPFGVSTSKLEQAARSLQLPLTLVRSLDDADAVVTLRSYFRRFPDTLREAEQRTIPVHVLRSNTLQQMQQVLVTLFHLAVDPDTLALRETEEAIENVLERRNEVELPPANAYVRRLQHAMAERYNLTSKSWGREPNRRVRIFPSGRE